MNVFLPGTACAVLRIARTIFLETRMHRFSEDHVHVFLLSRMYSFSIYGHSTSFFDQNLYQIFICGHINSHYIVQ